MAITNNNVQNVKFLRNGQVYNSHNDAYEALSGFTLTSEQDGTAILARYTATDNNVKTLVGWVYSGASGSYVTIQDIEGASSDVMALLGSGVTTANTVTMQLTQLSGNNESTSADTSVAGAKRYADNLISGLDYTDTVVAGEYVSQVSQADGVIAVTRAELPTVTAITEAGKPIIAVAEDKGTISASAGTIDSQYVTVTGFTATNVQGALEEISGDVTSAIDTLDYTGVTTGDGVVITNVTEEDGVVAATSANVGRLKLTDYTKGSDSGAVASTDTINQAVAKLENQIDAEKDARAAAISGLDYSDSAVSKNFVIEVDETDGVISVTRGSITSSAETIVLSDNADGGVNFDVNIDNDTIVQDETTKALKVASAALTQYIGDGKTIQISAADANNNKTVSTLLTLSSVTPSSTTVKEEYALQNASGETIGSTIKIYKDSSLVSITYITDPSDEHYQNLEYVYVDNSGNTQTEYVDMSTLVLEAEFESGVTADASGVVHGVVDPTSEVDSENSPFLTVGADGFKISGIKDEIAAELDAIVENLDADESGSTEHITVNVVEEDGVITTVTVEEDNIANADDLDELSGKTITAITSTGGSITTAIDDAVGNKSVNIETDASKIKMVGFENTDQSGFTAITSASTVTDAVEEIEAAFIANEQVVASALNDLNDRVDTVSGDVATISGKVDTIETNYVSGVSVNGTAVTTSNHVAPISISAATSATTATGNEAITVDTDANGNITLGLSVLDCGVY